MRDFINIIMESLASPFPFSWKVKNRTFWHATLMAVGEEYFISVNQSDGFPHPDDPTKDAPWYDLSFGITSNGLAGSKVLGTDGMAFRIFATAIAAFEEFIRSDHPEFIMLSASKDNENRLRLYQRIAHRFDVALRDQGYEPCEAPECRYVKTADHFDTLAWRRNGS